MLQDLLPEVSQEAVAAIEAKVIPLRRIEAGRSVILDKGTLAS